ncbi:MAG: deoxyribodipyrimidine photo-lyase, partial [Burkholderiaceae bacterium]|nr:deoxyribodipyrimidine photo-lyase [Burkholderiaceae bacterium]
QVEVLQELISRYGANEVHISQEYEPHGAARDARVEAAGIKLVRTGSPYAVAPGRVLKPSDATPYRVYTPFYKGWCLHGWRKPVSAPKELKLVAPKESDRNFVDWKVPQGNYDTERNYAGVDGTSKLSAHLTWGEIHPRTLLADLGESKAHDVYRKEIAWREFYADVLFNNPHSEKDYYAPRFKEMRYDKPGEK